MTKLLLGITNDFIFINILKESTNMAAAAGEPEGEPFSKMPRLEVGQSYAERYLAAKRKADQLYGKPKSEEKKVDFGGTDDQIREIAQAFRKSSAKNGINLQQMIAVKKQLADRIPAYRNQIMQHLLSFFGGQKATGMQQLSFLYCLGIAYLFQNKQIFDALTRAPENQRNIDLISTRVNSFQPPSKGEWIVTFFDIDTLKLGISVSDFVKTTRKPITNIVTTNDVLNAQFNQMVQNFDTFVENSVSPQFKASKQYAQWRSNFLNNLREELDRKGGSWLKQNAQKADSALFNILKPVGYSCLSNEECATGFCNNGICAKRPVVKRGRGGRKDLSEVYQKLGY